MSRVHEGLSPSTYDNPIFNQVDSQETLHQVLLEESYRENAQKELELEKDRRLYWAMCEVLADRFGEYFWAAKLRNGIEGTRPSPRQYKVFYDRFGGDMRKLDRTVSVRESQMLVAFKNHQARATRLGLGGENYRVVSDLFSSEMKRMRYHIKKHKEHEDEPFLLSQIPGRDFRE